MEKQYRTFIKQETIEQITIMCKERDGKEVIKVLNGYTQTCYETKPKRQIRKVDDELTVIGERVIESKVRLLDSDEWLSDEEISEARFDGDPSCVCEMYEV